MGNWKNDAKCTEIGSFSAKIQRYHEYLSMFYIQPLHPLWVQQTDGGQALKQEQLTMSVLQCFIQD